MWSWTLFRPRRRHGETRARHARPCSGDDVDGGRGLMQAIETERARGDSASSGFQMTSDRTIVEIT